MFLGENKLKAIIEDGINQGVDTKMIERIIKSKAEEEEKQKAKEIPGRMKKIRNSLELLNKSYPDPRKFVDDILKLDKSGKIPV